MKKKSVFKSGSPAIAVQRLKAISALRPKLAIVLGSGFSHALGELKIQAKIPYAEIPGFLHTGIPGHPGELLLGHLSGTPVLVLNGRAHFYEGHDLAAVTFPIRTLAEFGIGDLLLTNAAGGINRKFHPGDFMAITDHINFMGANPLRGEVAAGFSRFVDLSKAYDVGLRKLLQRAARKAEVKLRSGIYLGVAGPSYETPAEIRAFARWGADAVGMSTVPEVIVARQCGLRVAALSCITNLAAGRSRRAISHQEVLEAGERVKAAAAGLLRKFAELYGKEFLEKQSRSRKLRSW